MPTIETPTGERVFCATQEQADQTLQVLQARHAFAQQYCREKSWDFDNLSITQILEIRKQPGWASPVQIELVVQ